MTAENQSGTSVESCPFCERLVAGPLVAETPLAVALLDKFPVSRGHTLVICRRHEPDFFQLDHDEQAAVWRLVADVRQRLFAELSPAGFNVGLNAGAAAGQTVAHAHVHVIPRYDGDVDDPRGGVRAVIPDRAA
jgi:diadenosine tetraphosphate (Ap4A) HIT family hydrolase